MPEDEVNKAVRGHQYDDYQRDLEATHVAVVNGRADDVPGPPEGLLKCPQCSSGKQFIYHRPDEMPTGQLLADKWAETKTDNA